jgi:hypothetical protein
MEEGVVMTCGKLPFKEGEEVVEGGLITPPFAESHVHMDAALLGARKPNVSGTLVEGIENCPTGVALPGCGAPGCRFEIEMRVSRGEWPCCINRSAGTPVRHIGQFDGV